MKAKKIRPPKIPAPGSWTLKEKVDIANALCADERFSHAETRAAVTMALYFHNSASGGLFPSRAQISERCRVTKEVTISATRKMKRFGYLNYEESNGGRNARNTYLLQKPQTETVGNSDSLQTETVGKTDTGGRKFRHAGVGKTDTQLPSEYTTTNKEGSATLAPLGGAASASPERGAISGEPVVPLCPNPNAPPEGHSPEKREELLAKFEELKR